MVFVNTSNIIGQILSTGTATTTGNLTITLMIIMVMILAAALMFGIRLEFTAILIFPMLLSYMAYYSEFYAVGIVIIIYLAIILTKNWIFK